MEVRLSNSRIDRIGDSLRRGAADAACLHDLEAFRALYLPSYREVEKVLTEQLRLKITGRPAKSTVSIIEKLRRETTRLNQIQDIAGCRLICTRLQDQDYFVGMMRFLLRDCDVDDKRERPINGYRAVHVVANSNTRPVEIQVRTALQHAWAELSEKLADRYGHSIKYGQGNQVVLDFLEKLSKEVRTLDLLRQERSDVTATKAARGKSKALVRRAKRLSASDRETLKRVRVLFSEMERARI